MANRRLSVNSIREILRLSFACELSGRQIAASLGLSRSAVWECIRRAHAAKLTWPLPDNLDEATLYALLYPPADPATEKPKPDCSYIFSELKRKGMTLSLLWEEYKQQNHDGYQYTQFCEIYRQWLKKTTLVMRQEHKAGQKAFSDFSGGKLKIIDPHTGEVRMCPLFVCALGASNFTFVRLFESETAEAWCTGQARAFEYFSGCPELVVPDNPRAVISKACPYEPDVHPDFLLLAQHFDVAVVPARVRRPKDKAKVEAAVGLATRWILARLRNHTFFSLAEANIAIEALLEDLNNRPFKKIPGSRRSLFEAVEKQKLSPLPVNKYEYTHIERVRVRKDYHVEIENCFYSVPHQLVGHQVEARISKDIIEILFKGRRVASHPKASRSGDVRRVEEHMPSNHRAYNGCTPERFFIWARKVGLSTESFVQELFARKKTPELAYRACFGLTRLAKLHGDDRVEGACQRATALGSYSYKTVKLILQNNMDCTPLPASELPQQLQIIHRNIRGADYYIPKQEKVNADSSDTRNTEKSETARNGEGPGESASDTRPEQSAI